MEIAIFAFVIVFLLMASGLLLLFYRENLGRRLSNILPKRGGAAHSGFGGSSVQDMFALKRTAESLGAFANRKTTTPELEKGKSTVQQRLILAGYRGDSAVNML